MPIPVEYANHDAWLHFCAVFFNVKTILPEILALYRRHESNATKDLVVNKVKIKTKLVSYFSKLTKSKVLELDRLHGRYQALFVRLESNQDAFAKCLGLTRYEVTQHLTKIRENQYEVNQKKKIFERSFILQPFLFLWFYSKKKPSKLRDITTKLKGIVNE
jgi:hypothetical protein